MNLKLPSSISHWGAVAALLFSCISNINSAPINDQTIFSIGTGDNDKSITNSAALANPSTAAVYPIGMSVNEITVEGMDDDSVDGPGDDVDELFLKYCEANYVLETEDGEGIETIECDEPDCLQHFPLSITAPILTLDEQKLNGVGDLVNWFLKIGLCEKLFKFMPSVKSDDSDDSNSAQQNKVTSYKKVTFFKCKVSPAWMVILEEKLYTIITAGVPPKDTDNNVNMDEWLENTIPQSHPMENNEIPRLPGQSLGDDFQSSLTPIFTSKSNVVHVSISNTKSSEETETNYENTPFQQDNSASAIGPFDIENLDENGNAIVMESLALPSGSTGTTGDDIPENETLLVFDYTINETKYSINPFYVIPILLVSLIVTCIGGTVYNKCMGRTLDSKQILKVPRMAVFSEFPNLSALTPSMKANMMKADVRTKNIIA